MQYAVDYQMSPMGTQAFTLLLRLNSQHLRADHEIAERTRGHFRHWRSGEGQNIGRLVALPVACIQFATFSRPHDTYRNFPPGRALAKRGASPTPDTCRR